MHITPLADLIPQEFPAHSKVWIYQSSRAFIEKEEREINEQLYQFYAQWVSHGAPVKGWAKLLYKQFIVMLADDASDPIGGCSTDSSVRVVKSLERQYDVNFFDRLMITFLRKEKAEMLPFNQVQYALDKGFIDENTLLFNNLVQNKGELLEKWLIPLKDSWLAGKVALPKTA
jgi:hypothetical protein